MELSCQKQRVARTFAGPKPWQRETNYPLPPSCFWSASTFGWTVGYLLAMDIVSRSNRLAQLICLKFGKTGGLIRGIWDEKWANS